MASLVTLVQLTAVVTTGILVALCMVSAVHCQNQNFDRPDKHLVITGEQSEKDWNSTFHGVSKNERNWTAEINCDGIANKLTIDPKADAEVAIERKNREQQRP